MTAGTSPAPHPTLAELFAGFFGIGVVGFGGVLPWARRMMVEQRGWLSGPEFTDQLALCQFLPGPNICNMAVATGARFRGPLGSVVVLVGLLAAPMVIVILLGGLYARYSDHPVVRHAFSGLAAAAAALVAAMAVRIAWPERHSPAGLVVAGLAVLAIAVLRLPLLPTLAVLAPLGVLAMHRFGPRA